MTKAQERYIEWFFYECDDVELELFALLQRLETCEHDEFLEYFKSLEDEEDYKKPKKNKNQYL